ncbi:MAG: RNA-binding S4 domain-containing protein [Solobacterium sp.]|nr:RNA-binding S4 domain-containing protein [Solobacterium sp.]MBQ9825505.1 RNA-binding S4 domain-containing protein [Solobacterium sp.]
MRIDKFLKVSRILKRRAVSKELALNERIEINGRVVKPSHEVNPGDIVGITFGNRKLEVRVLAVNEVKRKQEAADLYEIVSETRIEDSVKL